MSTKPPYLIPAMAQVRELPWNGLNVASTFAGAGGSSTGYRMAGFRVLYANEFIPAAADTYRANARPGTVVDTTDIRQVSGADILAAAGLDVGELDILDGSPPCSAFSMAGRRSSGWGKAKAYSDGAVQVIDDLFFEYARLLAQIQPRVFVAENVAGLVRGVAKGYFKAILAALREPGYQVQARVLDAQWLGVPQARQRLIFVGVRNDLGKRPVHPTPLPHRYAVQEVLGHVARVQTKRHGFTGGDLDLARPAPTVMTRPENGSWYGHAVKDHPPGDVTMVRRAFQAERGSFAERFVVSDGSEPHPTIMATGAGGVREHQLGLIDTETVATGGLGPVWRDGEPFCPESGKALRLDLRAAGTSYAPPRGAVLRQLTIPELRVLCAFPADFELTGSYVQRWERLGRAVPPLMMRAVAATIAREVFGCAG